MPIVALLIVSIVLIAWPQRASVHLSHSFRPIPMAPIQPPVIISVMFFWLSHLRPVARKAVIRMSI
jgi:hypothetical protein